MCFSSHLPNVRILFSFKIDGDNNIETGRRDAYKERTPVPLTSQEGKHSYKLEITPKKLSKGEDSSMGAYVAWTWARSESRLVRQVFPLRVSLETDTESIMRTTLAHHVYSDGMGKRRRLERRVTRADLLDARLPMSGELNGKYDIGLLAREIPRVPSLPFFQDHLIVKYNVWRSHGAWLHKAQSSLSCHICKRTTTYGSSTEPSCFTVGIRMAVGFWA